MKSKIAVLPGDGIGPEITAEAVGVLQKVATTFGHELQFQEALVGGAAIDATGTALPQETLALCQESDAVLLGAVGGPKWDDPRGKVRPEQGLLGLRKAFDLFANLRPVKSLPELRHVVAAAARAAGGRRPDGGARADRRHLFRRAAFHREVRERGARPSTRWSTRRARSSASCTWRSSWRSSAAKR